MYGEKIVDGGKEKTIAINLVSEGFSLIKDYPNGCHAIIYGTVSLCRKQYHADAHTPDVAGLIAELAGCTACGHLFGGLAASRGATVQLAASRSGGMAGGALLGGVFSGGLTGVAFGADVPLITRVTQGCLPLGPWRVITRCEGNVVLELDGEPALDVMLDDMQIELCQPRQAMQAMRHMLAGLQSAGAPCPAVSCGMSEELARQHGRFGPGVLVRHLIGIDPGLRGLAVADAAH